MLTHSQGKPARRALEFGRNMGVPCSPQQHGGAHAGKQGRRPLQAPDQVDSGDPDSGHLRLAGRAAGAALPGRAQGRHPAHRDPARRPRRRREEHHRAFRALARFRGLHHHHPAGHGLLEPGHLHHPARHGLGLRLGRGRARHHQLPRGGRRGRGARALLRRQGVRRRAGGREPHARPGRAQDRLRAQARAAAPGHLRRPQGRPEGLRSATPSAWTGRSPPESSPPWTGPSRARTATWWST